MQCDEKIFYLINRRALCFKAGKTTCLRMHGVNKPKQFKKRTVKYLGFESNKKKHDFFFFHVKNVIGENKHEVFIKKKQTVFQFTALGERTTNIQCTSKFLPR